MIHFSSFGASLQTHASTDAFKKRSFSASVKMRTHLRNSGLFRWLLKGILPALLGLEVGVRAERLHPEVAPIDTHNVDHEVLREAEVLVVVRRVPIDEVARHP